MNRKLWTGAAGACLAGSTGATAQDLGEATWQWEVTTDDGDAIVEPGETATVHLEVKMEAAAGVDLAGFLGTDVDLLGGLDADRGEITDVSVLLVNPVPPFFGGDLITFFDEEPGFNAYLEQCLECAAFGFGEVLPVLEFEWTTTDFSGYTVEFSSVSDTVLIALGGDGLITVYLNDPQGLFPVPIEEATVEFAVSGCPADYDANGELSILDLIAYQGLFLEEAPVADCNGDGSFDVLDFICVQGLFVSGCP